ncbi:hypothetical protein MMPV_007689 [Pyropia vietnamensis]
MASQSASDCVSKCMMYSACTHFMYQPLPSGDGRCSLKRGPPPAKSASLRKGSSGLCTCGLLPERLASIPSVKLETGVNDDNADMTVTTPTPSPVLEPAGFHGDTLGNAVVGHNCDWPYMNDFADMSSSSPSDCLSLCNARSRCTHFVYQKTAGYGGWCYMKEGPVTVEEATLWGPSSTTYTCGLLPERLAPVPSPTATPTQTPLASEPAGFHGDTLGNAVVGHNCDWPYMNDFADMSSSSPSDCLSLCNARSRCTHFVYQKTAGYGGWCYMKEGPVTVEEATLWGPSSTTYTCGLLPERLAPVPSPTATPTQTPLASEPAGFHGDTLGNAVVGHNCDWPYMNDFADMSSSSPSDCLSLCNARSRCTHFVYQKTAGYGGWCYMKEGPVTVEEATLWGPSSTTYTCGLLPERLAPVPSPTATPTQTPLPSNGVVTIPTATPIPENPFDSGANKATCNIRKEDCADAKAEIMSRYLNERCLPEANGGLLAMSAAALSDALSAIEGYGCCALEVDRIMLLSVARLLVSSDTCAAMDAAALPTSTVNASLTNRATVEYPGIPPVNTSVTTLAALGVLSGGLAAGKTTVAQTNRRQVRQLVRNSVVIESTNPKQPSCCEEHFAYDSQGCCPGWCWIVADILPFFDLQMCCTEFLIPSMPHCPL